MSKLTIGKVAAHTGVAVDTLRFYERKGLIQKPPRNQSGYRVYTPESVERIQFIKRAREYGFSLSDIEGLVAIIETGPAACRAVRERIHSRIATIDSNIAHLQETRARLATLADACTDGTPCSDCRLIKAIAQNP